MKVRETFRALSRDQRGAALVEATILAPIMLILFLGVFEFSWFFYQQQLVEIGIRDAARYLSRNDLSTMCPCGPCAGTLVVNAQNLATTGSIDASTPSRVCTGGKTCWDVGDVTISCTLSAVPAGSVGSPYIITVTTPTHPDDRSLGFFGFLRLPIPTNSFTHSERSVGPG